MKYHFTSPIRAVIKMTDNNVKDDGTGHNKHPLPTTQEKTLYMDITRRSTPKSD